MMEKNAQEERSRACATLEMKSQSIAFKRSVARELDKAGLSYKQDYAEGVFVTDFLIEQNDKRVALGASSTSIATLKKPAPSPNCSRKTSKSTPS